MKKIGYLLATSVFSGLLAASGALAAGVKSIVVVNSTSYTLDSLFVSPSSAQADWVISVNTNLLSLVPGLQSVAPGGQVNVPIADDTTECLYDVMAILDGDNNYGYQYQVNACNGDTWTISG